MITRILRIFTAWVGGGSAESYPSRPIRMNVTASTGKRADIVAELVRQMTWQGLVCSHRPQIDPVSIAH